MRNRFRLFGMLFLALIVVQVNCAVPRLFWPQDNISSNELNESTLSKKVLVAAHSSKFKDAVVFRIEEALAPEPVYMKFIGIDELEEEDGAGYTAVILINTCVAWGMDRHVEGFLNRHEDQGHMVVLTTSGDGDWLPDMKGRDFDAVSSASEENWADTVAREIVGKTRLLLEGR